MKRREMLASAAAMLVGSAWYHRAQAQADVQGLKIRTLAGETVAVDAAAVKELAAGLQGDILVPGRLTTIRRARSGMRRSIIIPR
jgi:hypothetical protein